MKLRHQELLKLVFIGDYSTGKTSLIHRFVYNNFPTDYIPRTFEGYKGKITINDSMYYWAPWDCPPSDSLEVIRMLSYAQADIFMLCFSIVDKLSFERIKTKWYPEIKSVFHKPEILLIGTKSDLKQSIPPDQSISKDTAINMAKKIDAFDYIECSSLLGDGVKEAFDIAFAKAVHNKKCFIS